MGTYQSFGHLHHWTGPASLTEMLPETGLDCKPLLDWRPDALLTGLDHTASCPYHLVLPLHLPALKITPDNPTLAPLLAVPLSSPSIILSNRQT